MIHIIVPVEPVAQGRPRFSTLAMGLMPKVYDPQKSREFKALVKIIAQQYKGKPLDGPLLVRADFCRGIPKSWSKKKREQALKNIIKPIWKPDLTNYQKGIEDALNGIAYHDDAQIVLLLIRKRFSEEAKIDFWVWPDTEDNLKTCLSWEV
jgi:Holliday junction resolvase RusA-like endonuclease